jgi:hypothetical protein
MLGKGAKVVGAAKAATTANRLGKGFKATEIGRARAALSFGKESANIAGYHPGQLIGAKGANLITGVNLEPFSGVGTALDAGLKVAPKIYGHVTD